MENQETIQKTLMDELGLADLSAEKQEKLMVKMTEAILKRIFQETVEHLTETEQTEYAELIDNEASSQELETFLQKKIPHYDELVKKTVIEFKEDMKKA